MGGIPFADFLPSPPVCLSAPWPPHPTSPYAKSGGTTIVLMLPSRMPRTPSSNPSTTSSSPTMNLCAQSARVSYVMCCAVGKLLTAVACPVSSGRSTRLSLRETPGSLCILQCRRWPPQDRHQPAGYSKSGLEAAAVSSQVPARTAVSLNFTRVGLGMADERGATAACWPLRFFLLETPSPPMLSGGRPSSASWASVGI